MPAIPKDNKVYKQQSYWDDRFAQEDSYDWLAQYENVKEWVLKYVHYSDSILMVGCGNSQFSAQLYKAGYHNIINIDFSAVLIAKMKDFYPEMQWICADMTKLRDTFQKESFDVVIDKAAMDAIMANEGDVWSPNPDILKESFRMCSGISHVLTSTGTFLQISFSQPHFRKTYLLGEDSEEACSKSYGWDLWHHKIDIGLGYFFYVMKKNKDE